MQQELAKVEILGKFAHFPKSQTIIEARYGVLTAGPTAKKNRKNKEKNVL